MQHQSLRFIACALAAAGAGAAQAAPWRWLDTSTPQAFAPVSVAQGADGALWAYNYDGVRRFAPDGTGAGPFGTTPHMFDSVIPLADGGALLTGTQCDVARIDAALRARWQTSIAPTLYCRAAATRDGNFWIGGDHALVLFDGGGRIAAQIAPPTGNSFGYFLVTPSGGVVAMSGPQWWDSGSRVVLYDAGGNERWRWSRENLDIQRIDVAADGGVVIAGLLDKDPERSGVAIVTRLDANGASQWTFTTVPEKKSMAVEMSIAGDTTYLVTESNGSIGRYTFYRLDGGGRPQASHEVCRTISPARSEALLPTRAGDTPVFLCRGEGSDRFVIYGDDGVARVDTPLPISAMHLLRRDDGRFLVSGKSGAPSQDRFIAIDASGRVVDDPQTALRIARQREEVGQLLEADGTAYVVSQDASLPYPDEHHLSRIDANGKLVWRRAFDAAIRGHATVSTAGDQVCVTASLEIGASASKHRIDCVARSDGAPRWSTSIDRPSGMAPLFGRALDDGSFALVHGTPEWHEVHRYDAAGRRVYATRQSIAIRSASIGPSGRATLALFDGSTQQLAQYDTQGRRIFSEAPPAPFDAIELAAESTARDGSVVAFVRKGDRTALWSVAPDGRTLWTRDVVTRSGNSDLVRTSDALYVLHETMTNDRTATQRLSRHAPRDGVESWAVESTDTDGSRPARFAVSPSGDSLLVARALTHKLRLTRYDVATGAPVREDNIACDETCNELGAVSLDTGSNVRAALTVSRHATGMNAAVVSVPAPPARGIRIDQPGIAGAWWSPYANGEGIVIDYLPASRTFFAPWFTFSREGGNDPAGQRWYVIQGAVPANATSVELPITESSGGNFDAGPTVPARIVGKATFTFTDCNNATMYHTFDAATNGAANGSITLTRLVPSTENCVLADGTTQTNPSTPANGFNAKQSGSWFEPATSGQGLQFVVQPGGVFFAPWFTFDPAGPSDDPGRQRWFTIQGGLANATGGKVTAPIVQTIGGAFDRVPTNNMVVVGTATVTFNGCDSAKIDYRFDDTAAAGAMRSLAGSADLVKIGGCAQ